MAINDNGVLSKMQSDGTFEPGYTGYIEIPG
jgi:hypothetical protein